MHHPEHLRHELAVHGRLVTLPPSAPTQPGPAHGRLPLGVGGERSGNFYVPQAAEGPLPAMVMFHGAGGSAISTLRWAEPFAKRFGVLLIAPESQGATWDVIGSGFGPDVEFIDAALAYVFDRHAVQSECIAVGGFSDGASYALSLGLTNGDRFEAVMAFSPGFVTPGRLHGKPRIFISHGLRDEVLPIDACSRRIVPSLKNSGYDVTFHEFAGAHAVPAAVVGEAMNWWLGAG